MVINLHTPPSVRLISTKILIINYVDQILFVVLRSNEKATINPLIPFLINTVFERCNAEFMVKLALQLDRIRIQLHACSQPLLP